MFVDQYVDLTGEDLLDSDSRLTYDQLHVLITNLCEQKAEQFAMIGYRGIRGKEVWDCLHHRYRTVGVPALHMLVEDLMSLTVNDFMTWRGISVFK
jgi:hypothetical protein